MLDPHTTPLPQSPTARGIQLINTQGLPQVRKALRKNEIPAGRLSSVLKVLKEPIRQQQTGNLDLEDIFTLHSKFYINPFSRLTGVWDFVVIMTAYIMIFEISLSLPFGRHFWREQIEGDKYIIFYIVLMTLLLVDILVNFQKGYYAFGTGKVMEDRRKIIRKYLSYHFIIDATAFIVLTVPLFYVQFYVDFLQLIPMVLLYIKKFKCQGEIIQIFRYQRDLRNFFIILMLSCDVMLIGSFGASLFAGMDLLLWSMQYYGSDGQYYWLINDTSYPVNLIDGPWVQQYVLAQSFSTGTLSSLAPGPFGKNPVQILYSIILMTFFMLLASYVGEVIVYVSYTYEEVRIFHEQAIDQLRKNIQIFDRFMTIKGVAARIRDRVHNFFELIWEVEVKMDVSQQKSILDKFPKTLRQEVLLEMGFCRYLKIFSHFSKPKLIEREISFLIKSEVVDAGTLIFSEGFSSQHPSLYYVKSGLAKFYWKRTSGETALALSNLQRAIGQFQFITGVSHNYSCRAVDLCVVETITFADFLLTLRTHGLIQEYYTLKQKMLIEQETDIMCKTCLICEGDHAEDKCITVSLGQRVREELKQSQGAFEHQRRKIVRRPICRGKVMGQIELAAQVSAPSVFYNFKGLGNLIMNIGKRSIEVENVNKFTVFYPEFNAGII